MWPWRRKDMRRRASFWGKLFIFSSSAHLIVLVFLFFVYSGDSLVYNINVNRSILKSGAPIIFMPLKKVVGTNISTLATVSKKKPVKKETTLVKQKKKAKPKKKIEKKPKQQPKKTLRQASASAKTTADRQGDRIAKKSKHKKQVAKQKGNSSKKQVAKNKKIKTEKNIARPGQQPIYIGRFELEALHMQEAIEQEISKHWKPPAGLAKDLSCTIKVLVGWDGVVKKSTMVKQSGVLMYDVSARMAASSLSLKVAKGKEINITFNQ